jgi:phospholipid/cholesterol/gamma-HCH transport system substrate-binding protein
METRANFVLIGAFTLFGILGSLGFFLWLAKVEVDRQYAYYDILFTDVSGLGDAGDVRYNGLPVGQVVRLSLDRDDPGKVRVRIEIDAATPVKTDTIATLELQGVTGVSYRLQRWSFRGLPASPMFPFRAAPPKPRACKPRPARNSR